jgi:hypothetical protein
MNIIRSKSLPITEKIPLSKILDDITNIEDWYIIPKRKKLFIKLRTYSHVNLLQIKNIIKQNDYEEFEINEMN